MKKYIGYQHLSVHVLNNFYFLFSVGKIEPKRVPGHLMADDAQAQKRMAKKLEKQHIPQRTKVQRKVRLFEHLHQYEREFSLTQTLS